MTAEDPIDVQMRLRVKQEVARQFADLARAGRRRRGLTLAGYLVLLLAVTVGFSMIQHDRGVRRTETTAQHAADLKRDAAQRAADRKLAKDAYLTSCAHLNKALRAVRNTILGSANDLGRLVLQAFPDDPTAIAFAKSLDDSAVSRGNHDAPPIACTYPPPAPPKTKAGR